MKLYSKKNISDALSAMTRSGRINHSYVITGEKGTGRRTAAKYIAQSVLCESLLENGAPCGICRNCRRIENETHPDVIFPEAKGKTSGYKIDDIREIIDDSIVAPNDGAGKFYIFCNCDNINTVSQNALLKTIEEPPDHAYFIFTLRNIETFLPTIISRVTRFETVSCTEEECTEALTDTDKYSAQDISEAVSAYHGNIGRCIDYLEKGKMYELCGTVRDVASAMTARDEYSILKALSAISSRDDMSRVAAMLDELIRDALMLRLKGPNTELIGCSASDASALSMRISSRKASELHEFLAEAQRWFSISVNINLNAAACAMSARLCI